MRKIISVAAVASLFVAGTAMASGYRIPEQSADSTAKAGANIASAKKADVTYYNPAGMSLLEDAWHFEGTATYLHLTEIEYDDDRTSMLDATSEKEDFLLPTFFLVSPDYNNFRFGFSLTEPYGLQKRWKDPFASASAYKFSLKVFEFNPTVSYKINDTVSVGAGVRFLYNEATAVLNGTELGMRLDGDTTEWGYNLALDVKPSENLNLAVTYRSHVDVEFDGGDVEFFGPTAFLGNTEGTVTVPAPAVLTFSAAYTYEAWTFDFTVDQTFWSEYESIAFDIPLLTAARGGEMLENEKDWEDSVAVRLGVEYRMSEKVTLMGGVTYDESPAPEETLGFELPDSDAWLFSVGARYKYSDQMEFAVGVLYDYKEKREVTQLPGDYTEGDIVGEFTNASAFLVSFGLSYKFQRKRKRALQ